MATIQRRSFLKASGLSLLPAFVPNSIFASRSNLVPEPDTQTVRFFFDGELLDPAGYISKLTQINSVTPIKMDFYGQGGAVSAMEKKFEEITGKEKAIFMPTGTMANQLAISVLSGENAKVFVQETSHVFRDEADAAQTVFNKRLIPLAKGETYFTAQGLEESVDYHIHGEVFKSGFGAISVENPVRRADGRMVPIEEIRKISAYCRKNNFKLHLDGARIYMASAWSGTSIKEYASYFDTIYISLYKYLGASAGAVLCGDKVVIDKMQHLVKVHGGSMFGNWMNAAMVLHKLDGIEDRMQKIVKKSQEVFDRLNQLTGIKINSPGGGTNIYILKLSPGIDSKKLVETLSKDHSIWINRPNDQGEVRLTVNETLLFKETKFIADAFTEALKKAKT